MKKSACCGLTPVKSRSYVACVITCDCYDGAPDAGPQNMAWGFSEALAEEAWDELQEEWEDGRRG